MPSLLHEKVHPWERFLMRQWRQFCLGTFTFHKNVGPSSRAIPVMTTASSLPWYARFPQNVGASSGAIPVATMVSSAPWFAHFPQNVGASLGLIPVATMASSAPWLPLLPNSDAATVRVDNTPVFSFIWLVTQLTAPWWPLKSPALLGDRNSTDSGNSPPCRRRSFVILAALSL